MKEYNNPVCTLASGVIASCLGVSCMTRLETLLHNNVSNTQAEVRDTIVNVNDVLATFMYHHTLTLLVCCKQAHGN